MRSKIFFLFILFGCVDAPLNSNSNDELIFGNFEIGDGTPAGLRLKAAYEVLKNNCFQCHENFDIRTDADWRTSQYISPGNAQNSDLFLYLRGNNVGGPQNMPPGGQLTALEIEAIIDWINGL